MSQPRAETHPIWPGDGDGWARYCDGMTQPDWSTNLVSTIAGVVRRYRKLRGNMSTQQLADACAELGLPIPRSVLANLENGRRNVVSVPELLVLARALGIPPLLLIFPVGEVSRLEVLPGREMPTWAAAQWFTGEGPFLREDDDGKWYVDRLTDEVLSAWERRAYPVMLRREQDRLFSQWGEARSKVDTARHRAQNSADESDRQVALHELEKRVEERGQIENRLRELRSEIRSHGLDPGALGTDLEHLEPNG